MSPNTFDDWCADAFGRLLRLKRPGDVFRRLLRLPRPSILPVTTTGWPSAPTEGWEAAWEAATRALVANVSPEFSRYSKSRLEVLGRAFDTQSARINFDTLQTVMNQKLRVHRQDGFECNPQEDFWYFKINHGYWEQLFRILGTYDPVKMRIPSDTAYRRAYIDSAFWVVLEALMSECVSVDGATLSFPGMHVGTSLHNGSETHEELLQSFSSTSLKLQQVVLGASIGLSGVFESLFGAEKFELADGSFPKRAAMEGTLRETLHQFARHAQRVLFVVPPHLTGITLDGLDIPQETLPVPGACVHESWAAALYATVRHVLGRLETDTRVMVITQSAVFSAMLGIFLRKAKEALVPPGRQIFFFDLGQALDSATPESGGLWITRYQVADPSLFRIQNHGARV